MTTTTPAPTTPRRSALPRPESMTLAATEYARIAGAVAALDPADWDRPTDCPDWTVHQLISHVVGMAAMTASITEMIRQNRVADRRPNGEEQRIDALTAFQVTRYGVRSPAELTALLARLGPRAAAARRRLPGFLRKLAMPGSERVNGVDERWTVGYLTEVILTRDPWMHRIDLSRATGRPLELTAEHDGRVVDDVVREWAQRHGAPYRLTLHGPAGGTWASGAADGPMLELDAIEFCRILSGRASGSGLLTTEVPF
ncbi:MULTISPECIES: maleylpyruvate isomerase family mycothiol-dependent enzyme [Nocardia]|uniref:maleylpyruvate isomerase family mycothiol-dependent enzyme n=1 Tax=Nocardia TaxID=1817 RepID=UPI0021059E84|nr:MULTISPECIES: maleylpyruvate isomerase family mycothiol-dependent enzyme [Nocardia]